METIRKAKTDDIPALYALWKAVFSDSDAFLKRYFERYFDPDEVLTVSENGRIVSMSTVYRHAQLLINGQGQGTCPCIFAVATDEEARGRGLAMELIRRQIEEEKAAGTPYMMIAPAEESLFDLYGARFGFRPYFAAQVFQWVPPVDENIAAKGKVLPLSPAAYHAKREAYLYGTDHTVFTDRQIFLEQDLCILAGGGLFALCEEGNDDITYGIFAAERTDGGAVRINELLVKNEMLSEALSLIHTYIKGSSYEVRIPPFADDISLENLLQGLKGRIADRGITDTAMILQVNACRMPKGKGYAGFLYD